MKQVSLVGTAGYLPETVVDRAFFASGASSEPGMFRGPKTRRHVAPGETAPQLIEKATKSLCERLGIRPERDVDLLLTNVSIPDMAFTGCGASVARVLGIRSPWVIDLHNAGCVSFVYMIAVARAMMSSLGAKTALLCTVQNTAGRLYAHEANRTTAPAPVPGDGCGVGYLIANGESPVRAVVAHCYPENADDMRMLSGDGSADWWEPRPTPLHIAFTEESVAAIVARGNALVPAVVREACDAAALPPSAIDVLVTNQPNTVFLRRWREALNLRDESHVDTFEEHGNLFGAGIPICIERAVETGRLKRGDHLALGGFSHAGDYAAAAIVHWYPS